MTPDNGWTKAPDRYSARGRETIDRIRDDLGDAGLFAFCVGNAMKYRDRAGRKEGASAGEDCSKARWYEAMARHVVDPENNPDPRAARDGFVPYQRPAPPTEFAARPLIREPGYRQEQALDCFDEIPRGVSVLFGLGIEPASARRIALRLFRAGLLQRARAKRVGGPGAGQPGWLYWRTTASEPG